MSDSRPSASEATLPGTDAKLGRYRIIERLGVGGMGQVFVPQRDDSTELVALKQVAIVDPTLLYR